LNPLPVNRQVRCLTFSPDGTFLALGDGEGNLILWDLVDHKSRTLKAHDFPVLTVAFTADGKTLATGGSDRSSIRLWDVASGEPKTTTVSGQVGDAWALAFTRDGLRLASGTRDGPIRIWHLDETEPGELIPGRLHADEYGNFLFAPDSQQMAGGCADGTVKVWNVATLQVTAVLSNASYVAAFSSDGRSVLVSTKDGQPQWRDLAASKARPVPAFEGNIQRVLAVDLSPDRRLAALALPRGLIQLQDIEAGKSVRSLRDGHAGDVRAVAFAPAADKLISGGADKTLVVWDVATGRQLWKNSEHRGSVCAVAVSPDGAMLASGCGAETIKLWNLSTMSTGSLASISYHRSAIRTLAFSPDGSRLASGSEDNTVKLWHVALRRELASFKHDAHVRLVAFSHDGNTLATVTDRGTLRVFRTTKLRDADQGTAAR
jgi:WD40 repeat protein